MSHVEKLSVSYPEYLGVIQLGNQHQALGGKDLRWLDDRELLICFIHLAGLSLLQVIIEQEQTSLPHQTTENISNCKPYL